MSQQNNLNRKKMYGQFFAELLKDKYMRILLAIFLVSIIIRVYIFFTTLNQPLWWDEADYTSTARRWGLGLNVNDVWYYRRTFFLPLLWAGLFAIGGNETLLRLSELLFSVAVVFLTYYVGKEMFNKKVGLFAAFFASISRIALFLTGRLLNETPAVAFLLAGLLFFWKGYIKDENKKYIWLAALFFALAISTRLATFLSLVPIAILIFTKEKFKFFKNKHLWIAAFIILLVLSPFFYLYYTHYGANSIMDFIGHYMATAPDQGDTVLLGIPGIWQYFMNLLPNSSLPVFIFFIFGLIIILFNLMGIDLLFKKEGDEVRKTVFILLWIAVPIIYHGLYSEYMQERYLMWIYPIVFSLAGLGAIKIYDIIRKKSKTIAIICIAAVLLFAAYNQVSAARDIIIFKEDSYLQVKQSGEWLKENTEPTDVIISKSRQHNYYTDRPVYNIHNMTEAEFEKEYLPLNPKYWVVSIYEYHPDWAYTYAQRHNETFIPVKVYMQDKTNPSIVIYEFTNRTIASLPSHTS